MEETTATATPDYDETVQKLVSAIPDRKDFGTWRMTKIQFEKDDDKNLHMDYVTACSNLRARNYKIGEANKHQTKFIAGKIIPAIATTTALVTGLVCLELYKLIQGKHLVDFRNTYVNLAVPIFTFSDPFAAETKKCKLKDKGEWKWNLWDQLDVDIGDVTLEEFLEHMKEKHGLNVQSIAYGDASIYNDLTGGKKKKLGKKLSKLVSKVSEVKLTDLTLTFVVLATDDEDKDQELPPIRFKFRNKPGKPKKKKDDDD
eukprot:TRINITY_DN23807_c0_g1_i2.p1 TRINITY_DN23807_c0_g1~~TRINITY_DN23807_c0_g1_i2.p1  ORF type:complete len:302 (+),score=60.62 TRINITY_DN23807_c0_g1_i2:135-908(+)